MKKLMSLLLALIMVIGTLTVPTFAYSDVEDGTYTSEAITVLTDLDILHGFVDGSFKPDDTITRAQMATVICNALGYGKIAQTPTVFKDVPKEHWASGYIEMINGLGIVAGYGGGYYGPEDPVTYEQVAKIIVSTLGYTPMANEKGGWYQGYLNVAAQLDITDHVPMMIGKPAPRGAVAAMVYNALDVDMMEQIGFGSYAYYKVIENKTLLSNNLDIAKIEGFVKVVDFADKEADITVSKADPSYKEIVCGDKTFDTAIDLAPYKNLSCTLYLDMSGRKPVIVSAIADDSINSIVLTNKQINSISDNKVSYYKNIDDKRTSSITLDTAPNVYLNNGSDNTIKLTDYFGANAKDYSTMTFIDADNNGKYETVVIEIIESFVVSSVNIRTNTIVVDRTAGHTYNSNKLVLGEDVSYVMNMDLADVEVGDVVNVKTSNINGSYHYDIIVTNDTVTGTVEAKDANYYYIDDEPYTALTTVRLGDTGVFSIDMAGNILAIDKTATQTSVKWGYVVGTHKYAGLDDEYVIKLVNLDGKEEIFDFAPRVRVEKADAAKIETVFDSNIGKNFNNKLVAYKLNARNEVTAIYSTTEAISEYVDDSFVVKNVGADLTYKADGRLGSYYVSKDTMIFSVDNDEVDVITSSALRATENYTITTVVYDASTNDLIVALGQNITATVDPASPVMLVKSIGYAINDMIIVEGYVDGEVVEFMYDSNEFNVKVKKGDLVQYTLVGNEAIGMNVICNVAGDFVVTPDKEGTASDEDLDAYVAGHDEDFFVYRGTVVDIRGINIEFKDRDARVTMPDGNYGVYKYTADGRIYANEFIEDVDTEAVEGVDKTTNKLLVVKYDNVPLIAVIVDNQ